MPPGQMPPGQMGMGMGHPPPGMGMPPAGMGGPPPGMGAQLRPSPDAQEPLVSFTAGRFLPFPSRRRGTNGDGRARTARNGHGPNGHGPPGEALPFAMCTPAALAAKALPRHCPLPCVLPLPLGTALCLVCFHCLRGKDTALRFRLRSRLRNRLGPVRVSSRRAWGSPNPWPAWPPGAWPCTSTCRPTWQGEPHLSPTLVTDAAFPCCLSLLPFRGRSPPFLAVPMPLAA